MTVPPRARVIAFAASLIVALCATAATHAQTATSRWQPLSTKNTARQLVYEGFGTVNDRRVPVTVVFLCDTTRTRTETGAVGFEVYVNDAAALAPFHLDDFEGPDAPALKRTPLQATVTRASGLPMSLGFAPSGWYPREGRFAFGVTATNRVNGAHRRLMTSLASATSLHVVIADLRDAKVKLDLTVPVAAKHDDFTALLAGLN